MFLCCNVLSTYWKMYYNSYFPKRTCWSGFMAPWRSVLRQFDQFDIFYDGHNYDNNPHSWKALTMYCVLFMVKNVLRWLFKLNRHSVEPKQCRQSAIVQCTSEIYRGVCSNGNNICIHICMFLYWWWCHRCAETKTPQYKYQKCPVMQHIKALVKEKRQSGVCAKSHDGQDREQVSLALAHALRIQTTVVLLDGTVWNVEYFIIRSLWLYYMWKWMTWQLEPISNTECIVAITD